MEAAPPKKSKKKLIVIVVLLLLIAGSGVALMLLLKPAPAPGHNGEGPSAEAEAKPAKAHDTSKPPTFVDLGSFTANLAHEEGDRYLQATISLKLSEPELVDKIKANSPEIQHRVNMRLQSKRPSELFSYEGKQILAEQIRGDVEYVLGMRKAPPQMDSGQTAQPARKTEINEVLFTSFIIQ
ncbi:MAG: hypothetical protein A2Z95_00085 [Gallionellales bacterium GWA2_60_18]|nr:MAG: hypothetical protein A2Z95_00085 [Gallionellales bacterium GWA2_60_18]